MGELARKPGAPELAKSPLELLTLRSKDFTIFDTYIFPVIGALCGAGFIALENRLKKRPIYAGIYKHLVLGAAGWYGGTIFRNFKHEWRMDNDAVLRHYVSLHPEEFPPYERRRIGELFKKWTPIR